jgi:hypothetical protein
MLSKKRVGVGTPNLQSPTLQHLLLERSGTYIDAVQYLGGLFGQYLPISYEFSCYSKCQT